MTGMFLYNSIYDDWLTKNSSVFARSSQLEAVFIADLRSKHLLQRVRNLAAGSLRIFCSSVATWKNMPVSALSVT